MNRKEIFDIMNHVYPTYWPSQKTGECTNPYVVLKYKNQSSSLGNKKAGWQYVDVMIYIPTFSILPMDNMTEDITNLLKGKLEFTGNITPDYIDIDVKAIMRSMEFRIPKVIQ